jgi:hypothetical protein
MLINIAGLTDERGLKIAVRGMKLIIPKELQFIAERVINSNLRSGTADNDLNAMKSMGMLPDGAVVNHFLTDTENFFIKTDAPNGFKCSSALPLRLQWKVTSTLVICDSRPVSVTASVSLTGVQCTAVVHKTLVL